MLLLFVAFFNASFLAVVGLVLSARGRYDASWVCIPFLFWTPSLVDLAFQCVGRLVLEPWPSFVAVSDLLSWCDK